MSLFNQSFYVHADPDSEQGSQDSITSATNVESSKDSRNWLIKYFMTLGSKQHNLDDVIRHTYDRTCTQTLLSLLGATPGGK